MNININKQFIRLWDVKNLLVKEEIKYSIDLRLRSINLINRWHLKWVFWRSRLCLQLSFSRIAQRKIN